MKTFLITALTTALLSFNCFADNTFDTKDMAGLIAKEGLQQLNVQLANTANNTALPSLEVPILATNYKPTVLLAKAIQNKQNQLKKVTQVAGE